MERAQPRACPARPYNGAVQHRHTNEFKAFDETDRISRLFETQFFCLDGRQVVHDVVDQDHHLVEAGGFIPFAVKELGIEAFVGSVFLPDSELVFGLGKDEGFDAD